MQKRSALGTHTLEEISMRRWICFCSSLLAMYSSDAMALNASSLTETRSARVI